MSKIAVKRLKWTLLIAVPVLLLAAMMPGIRARRQYAATRALLIECQRSARVPEIKRLIAEGADVNGRCLGDCPTAVDKGLTPLHLSVRSSATDSTLSMKALLDAGANINAGDTIGSTALMTAVNLPAPEIVEFLIAQGADVNSRTNPIKFPDSPIERKVSALDFVNRTSGSKFQRSYGNMMPLDKLNRIKQMLVKAGAK